MTFSIIIPAYNCEDSLPDAVRSVALQSYHDYEIIIINDGSTDQTPDVIDRLTEQDDRIRSFSLKNQGPAAARNFGLLQAGGEYILFLDSDDRFLPDALNQINAALERQPCDVLVFGFVQHFLDSNRTRMYCPPEEFDVDTFYRGNHLNPVWNKAFRASFLRSSNICFQSFRYGEDRLFNADCLLRGASVRPLSQVLYEYRMDGRSSLISQYQQDKHIAVIKINETYATLCKFPQTVSYMTVKALLSCVTVLFDASCPFTTNHARRSFVRELLSMPQLKALLNAPTGDTVTNIIRSLLLYGTPGTVLLAGYAVYKTQASHQGLFLRFRR